MNLPAVDSGHYTVTLLLGATSAGRTAAYIVAVVIPAPVQPVLIRSNVPKPIDAASGCAAGRDGYLEPQFGHSMKPQFGYSIRSGSDRKAPICIR